MALTHKELLLSAALGIAALRLKGTSRRAALVALLALVLRRFAAKRCTNKHPHLMQMPVLGNSLTLLQQMQSRPTPLIRELAEQNGFKNFDVHWAGGLE
jgi:hypothetical protein